MTSEDINSFLEMLQLALCEGNFDYALKLFTDETNVEHLKNCSSDLISVITEHLTEENMCNNNDLYKCSSTLLNIIGDHSNPEDALLDLMNEIEKPIKNAKFVMLLEPLQRLIARISPKKVHSLIWTLNSIQTYIQQLDSPEYTSLEDNERLLVDDEDSTISIVNTYKEVLFFYSQCINKITEGTHQEIKLIYCKFLIQLLGEPLGNLSIHIIDNTKSKARMLAEDIVQKIFQLTKDPFIFSGMILEKKQDEYIKPNIESTAHLFYLIFSENICVDDIPQVYSSTYLFHTSINLALSLLSDNNLLVVEKSLNLCNGVFLKLKGQSFSFHLLEYEYHSKFCNSLIKIMIYIESKEIRKKALIVFEMYLKFFDTKGVYLIIYNLVPKIEHGGFNGFLIMFYKSLLDGQFTKNEDNIDVYFRGPKLFNLLLKFCFLCEKENTNLIVWSDQIISALNFVRYLALKDKRNVTKIWDFFPTVHNIYFIPLRKALELCRAHYKTEIGTINDRKLCRAPVSVTANGFNLPLMNKHEELENLKSSLTVLDVIDGLLSRVVEIIEEKTEIKNI